MLVGALPVLLALATPGVACAQEEPEPPTSVEATVHRQILERRINEMVRQQVLAEVFGTVDLGMTTAFAALSVHYLRDEPRVVGTYLAGAGLMDAGATASLFATRDTRTVVLEAAIAAVPATLFLGLSVADDPGPFPRLTTGSLAAGYFSSGLLTTLNSLSRRTSYSTLRAHQTRLADGEHELSETERRTMHDDLMGARGSIPRWVQGTPLIVASAVALSPAFDDQYTKNEQTYAALFGGLGMAGGLLSLFGGTVDHYESDLKRLRVSAVVVPGGFSFRGAFTAF